MPLTKQREEVALDEAGIDVLSQLLAEGLERAGVNRKDIIRLRLAVEEILGLWKSAAENEMVCTFRCGTRLGRRYIEITAPEVIPENFNSARALWAMITRLQNE